MLRPRRGEPTGTNRTEALSDGVFAVAITLLALDLSRIHPDSAAGVTLWASLSANWPTLLAFIASFMFVGVAWMNHHHVFARVKVQSRSLAWANLMLLSQITVIPWATATLAQSLGDPAGDHGRQAALLYAFVTGFGALCWQFMFHVLGTNATLLKNPSHAAGFLKDRNTGAFTLLGSGIIGVIGYFGSPLAAIALFFWMTVFYAIAAEGFE